MEDLISKKEVLEKYGISYGALYRWKRLGLIPEDWFVKKSAVTGQETFFHRDAITERIETILQLKDTLSLEEIAVRLRSDTQKKRMLRLEWQYGNAEIPIDALLSATVTDRNGHIADVTEKLKKVFD